MSKPLPSNIEAEQALLGAIMVNPSALDQVMSFLRAEHFYEPFHRSIYEIFGKVLETGKSVNPITIKPFLPETTNSVVKPFEYLVSLASNAVNIINAKDFGFAIYDMWERRRVISACSEMIDAAYSASPDVPGSKIAASGIEELGSMIAESPKDDGPNSAASIVDMLLSDNQRAIPGIQWPLVQMKEVAQDNIMAGQLTGLLSSSGEGKTSLVLQTLYNAARNDSPVLFLSYDQSGTECAVQMATQRLGIEGIRIRQKQLQEREFERYLEFLNQYRKMPIVVQRCTREGVEQLRSHARQFIKRYAHKHGGVPLIVIDHVRKITPKDPRAHEGRIASEINGGLKALGVEYDAAVIALNQRNSQGMKRPNPRPISADMFGGEMAKEDYDTILYLYRPDKYKEEQLKIAADEKEKERIEQRFASWEGLAEIGALKVRFGNPNIRRKVRFVAEYTRYESMRDEVPEMFEN